MRDPWLKRTTGTDDVEWVTFVQKAVNEATDWEKGPEGHGITDVKVWLDRLAERVAKATPKDGHYDENIWAARVMGLVLVLWAVRVHRAKTQDPHRPVKLRRQSYRSWLAFMHVLFDALTDESRDHDYFPQMWDPPFAPNAHDGDFV